MAKSLYAQYVKERENAEVLEYDWGFATYKMAKDHVYLQELYVVPTERKNGHCKQMYEDVLKVAKDAGIKVMYGSVVPSTPFGNSMYKIMLDYGFKLHSSSTDIVYLKKDI